jgi:WD40 repeat protein
VGVGSVEGIRPIANQTLIAVKQEQDLTSLLRTQSGLLPTQPVLWTSSDSSVAYVAPTTGKVVGNKVGTAILTGTLSQGNGAASSVRIEVQVVEKAEVREITLSPADPTLGIGERVKLVPRVQMANGEINANVVWSSSDDTVAVVNKSNGEVSALREGVVTIIAAYAPDVRYRGLIQVTIRSTSAGRLPATTPSPTEVRSPLPSVIGSMPVSPAGYLTPRPGVSPSDVPATPLPTMQVTPDQAPSAAPTQAPKFAARPSRIVYNSSPAGVSARAWRPDSSAIATAEGLTLYVRETNGNVIDSYEKIFESTYFSSINSVEFSKDGNQIAAAMFVITNPGASLEPDGSFPAGALGNAASACIKVIDAQSGREVYSFSGHAGGAYDVAFSPDGNWLASSSPDNTIKIWNLSTGKEHLTLTGHTSDVFQVKFNALGTRVLSYGLDKTVRIWDTKTGIQETSYRNIELLNFSQDGELLATIKQSGIIEIISTKSGKLVGEVSLEKDANDFNYCAFAFHPDGLRVASGNPVSNSELSSGTAGGVIKMREISSGQELGEFRPEQDSNNPSRYEPAIFYDLSFSPNGKYLAGGNLSSKYGVYIWSF